MEIFEKVPKSFLKAVIDLTDKQSSVLSPRFPIHFLRNKQILRKFVSFFDIHNLGNRTTVHLVTTELNPFSFSSFAEVHEVKHHEIGGSVTQILIRDSEVFTYATIMALKC